MRAPAVASLLGLLLLAPPVAADTYVFQSGQEFDGFPLGRTPRKELLVGTPTGRRTVAESLIKEVRPSANAAADFPKYLAPIGKKDADALAALGAWAKERGLADQSKQAFEMALAINPAQEKAKEGLGFVKVGGSWIPPEQAEERRKSESVRTELADRLEKLMGTRPEVEVLAHWRCADFLGDGKILPRLQDLELAFDEAVRVFGSDPWKGTGLVVLCHGQEQYVQWLEKDAASLPGMGAPFLDGFRKNTGMKWSQPPILGRSDLPDRTSMHAANVHAAGHILLNNWKRHNRAQPFWIEEGFGGWMESTVLKSNTSFCWQIAKQRYGSTFRDTKAWEVDDPDWHALVKAAAAKNEFLPLDQLDSLPNGEYSRREVGQAFSLVAFLLKEKGPEKFREYVAQVKDGVKSPVALEKAYGETFESLEPQWKAFVQGSGW
jgi:hypothetical protein